MAFAWGALIPAAASLISGLMGQQGQEDTNDANVQLGREQMAFQERMSSTAYPRAVQGMKDAGLNPMLAYSQGGASSPVGSMPQVQNPVSAGLNSAAQAMASMQAVQSLRQSQAQTDQIAASADKLRSETFDQNLNSAVRWSELEKLHGEAGELSSRSGKQYADTELSRLALKRESATFAADVAERKARARLTGLEADKQGVLKSPYELIEKIMKMSPEVISKVPSSANGIWEYLKSVPDRWKHALPFNSY